MAYFRALADAPSEQDATWRSTLAGLVAMRLVDAWATEEPLPDAGLRALERAINMMDVDAPEREPLTCLRRALAAEEGGRVGDFDSPVLKCTFEYAESLWLTAEWALASDACRTVIRHGRTASEHDIVPLAYDRLGHCLLARGRQDAAMEAFQTGRSFASSRGDTRSDLFLRISEAIVERRKTNYLAAECILDEVIAETTFASMPELRARATHDRGVIAYNRGDYARALSLYFLALDGYGTDSGADRVLADIAVAVLELGHRDIARSILIALEKDSAEQIQRWTATVNLMRIAMLEDDEPLFDQYRRTLARVHLPVRQRAHYHLFAAKGWLRFDQPVLARRELQRAQYVIGRYRVSELDEELAAALSSFDLKTPKGEKPLLVQRDHMPDLRRWIDRAPAAAMAWQCGRRSADGRYQLAAAATT